MPLLLLLLVLLPVLIVALTPLLLFQRYRVGTSRREARPWLATFGLAMMAVSALLFLVGAVMTTFWVPGALTGAAAGLGAGAVLGLAGLLLTRWEATPRTLHYTPNRILIFFVTTIVAARVVYGLYRTLVVAQTGASGTSLVLAFGIPESLAAGGTVIGYYLAYQLGVRWRIRRWQRRPLRPM